jgi:hypothetical protein
MRALGFGNSELPLSLPEVRYPPTVYSALGIRLSYWLKLVVFHPIAGIFFETDLQNFFVIRGLT